MTNRTKTINGKTYHLVSSGNNPDILRKSRSNYKNGSILSSNSVRVVRFNDKEAAFEGARYGLYVR